MLPGDQGQFPLVELEQVAEGLHPDGIGALEGHLVQQGLARGAEHGAVCGQDPGLGHHSVYLGLGRGAQGHQLGPVADELPQLAQLRRRDPGLGEVVAPQAVGQLGGVAFIVLDPPGVPVQPEGMDQVHVGALGLEQVSGPVPAVGRLQDDFGVGAGLGQLQGHRHGVVVDPHALEHLAVAGHADHDRAAAVQVDADILSLLLHQGPPPSRGFGFGSPECLNTRSLTTG